jgi:hypothetical protein
VVVINFLKKIKGSSERIKGHRGLTGILILALAFGAVLFAIEIIDLHRHSSSEINYQVGIEGLNTPVSVTSASADIHDDKLSNASSGRLIMFKLLWLIITLFAGLGAIIGAIFIGAPIRNIPGVTIDAIIYSILGFILGIPGTYLVVSAFNPLNYNTPISANIKELTIGYLNSWLILLPAVILLFLVIALFRSFHERKSCFYIRKFLLVIFFAINIIAITAIISLVINMRPVQEFIFHKVGNIIEARSEIAKFSLPDYILNSPKGLTSRVFTTSGAIMIDKSRIDLSDPAAIVLADHNYTRITGVKLLKGHFPTNSNGILISSELAEKFAGNPIGQKVGLARTQLASEVEVAGIFETDPWRRVIFNDEAIIGPFELSDSSGCNHWLAKFTSMNFEESNALFIKFSEENEDLGLIFGVPRLAFNTINSINHELKLLVGFLLVMLISGAVYITIMVMNHLKLQREHYAILSPAAASPFRFFRFFATKFLGYYIGGALLAMYPALLLQKWLGQAFATITQIPVESITIDIISQFIFFGLTVLWFLIYLAGIAFVPVWNQYHQLIAPDQSRAQSSGQKGN